MSFNLFLCLTTKKQAFACFFIAYILLDYDLKMIRER